MQKIPCAILTCLAVLGTFFSSAPAIDLTRGIIYDVPDEFFEEQFGERPRLELTPKEIESIRNYRFTADTAKVLVIPIEWSNRPHTYSTATLDSMLFSRDIYPGGSLADYFHEVSYGRVAVVGDVLDWFNAGTYVGWYDFEDILPQIDPVVDFSQYDGNADGVVDAVLFLRSGTGQEDSQDPMDIWSYAYVYLHGYGPGPFDGMHVSVWNTSPELYPLRIPEYPAYFSGEDTLNNIRVFCHELSHNLGAPDLYDYDAKLNVDTYDTPADSNDHPVYDWCLMGYGGYGIFSLKQKAPTHLCGWNKKQFGWVDPIMLQGTFTDVVLYNIETRADSTLYLLPINPYEGEYFLLEYRNPQSSAMFDKQSSDFSCFFWPNLTFGSEPLDRGLLITHIHDSVATFSHHINNGWPSYDHYTVAVEDAGYNPDHDAWSNPEGYVTDSAQWWYPYETRLGALFSDDVDGQNEFGPATYPSSDGHGGPTGIVVRVDSIVDDRLYVYIHNPVEFAEVAVVTPAPNAINATDDSITITFSGNVDPATINGNTIKIHSSRSGYLAGDISFDGEAGLVVVEPVQSLIPGDRITAQLTSGVQAMSGMPLMYGFVWEYLVESPEGYGVFGEPRSVDAGTAVSCIAAADIDADGDLDLVATLPQEDAVVALVNDGGGFLTVASSYTVGDQPWVVVAAALDDDNDIDLAVAGHGTSQVSILANDGAGNFSSIAQANASAPVECLDFADLDGDGDFDLVAGSYTTSYAYILRNLGAANFESEILFYGGYPLDIHPFDIEGDGDFDLVAACDELEFVLLYGNSANTISWSDVIYGYGHPGHITAADLDGDGDVDLATTGPDSGWVTIDLFDPVDSLISHYPVGSNPSDIVAADFDGDGDIDVAVSNRGANSVSVLMNNGDGSFMPHVEYPTGGTSPISLCAGDFNGDDVADLAVANYDDGTVDILVSKGLYVCGDANGDDIANVADAVFIINYVFKKGPAPDPLDAGNANCDADVNVGDAVYLINYVFKNGDYPCCP